MAAGHRAVLVASAVLAASTATLVLVKPAASEIARGAGARISVSADIAPRILPRHGAVPVSFTLSGRIRPTSPADPPQLRALTIAINAHGHLSSHGLPDCRRRELQPSTDREALAACRSALVGAGRFAADLRLPQQSPLPSRGRLLAFNAHLRGRPAILVHLYGSRPTPTSYVIPFLISRSQGDAYGTLLRASLRGVTGRWGFIDRLTLRLSRTYRYRGASRSYLSASCPAPPGFGRVPFRLARTIFGFAGGHSLTSTVVRSCRVRQ